MLVFFAYAASLIAMVVGAAMTFQVVVGLGQADKNATAQAARVAPAAVTRPAVSSAAKVADRREEVKKPKKAAVQHRPRSRVAERRPQHYNPYGHGYYNNW